MRTLLQVQRNGDIGSPQPGAGKAVTLTGLYTVMEALRQERQLTAKEKAIHNEGLVGVLKSLQDELDAVAARR